MTMTRRCASRADRVWPEKQIRKAEATASASAPGVTTAISAEVGHPRYFDTFNGVVLGLLVAANALPQAFTIGAASFRTVNLLLVTVFALGLAVQFLRLRPSLPRRQLALLAVGLFGAVALMRITEWSFVYYDSWSMQPYWNSQSLIQTSLLILFGTTLILLCPSVSVNHFAWVVAVACLSISLATGETGGIWGGRALAMAVLSALLARGLAPIRWIVVSLGCGMLLANSHQGPIFGLGVGMVVYLLSICRGSLRWILHISLVVVTGGALLAADQLFAALDADGNATIRMDHWATMAHDISGDLLFGHGFASTPDLYLYAHNSLLDVAYGLGLLGLATWGLALLRFAFASWRTSLAPLWAATLVFSLFSGHFAANPNYWYVGAVAVAAWGASPREARRALGSDSTLRPRGQEGRPRCMTVPSEQPLRWSSDAA